MLHGEFPELMKNADVSPLYKSKLECEPNNYRPISLLLTIFKNSRKIDVSENLQIHGSHWSNIQ